MDFLNIGRCSKTLKTSETISVDGVVNDGPDLPKQVDMAAIAKMNDTGGKYLVFLSSSSVK